MRVLSRRHGDKETRRFILKTDAVGGIEDRTVERRDLAREYRRASRRELIILERGRNLTNQTGSRTSLRHVLSPAFPTP